MVRVPTPYDRDDDVPVTILTFKRGSNNTTRATFRILEYENGDMCMQLEDQQSGGEMWLDEDDLAELTTDLTDTLVALLERRTRREGK